MENPNNRMIAAGHLESRLELSHEVMNEPFYTGTLLVKRLSGAVDRLPVTIPGKLMGILPEDRERMMLMTGQVRSYNKVIEGAGRLLITGFAQRLLDPDCEENPNQVQLTGALCKPPSYRTTPFGREIADLMLAVNRAYGKSDYIPCITWGRTARFASHLKVGDKVTLLGRFQSRAYQKQLADGTVLNKTAYEVSVGRLSMADTIVQPATPYVMRPGAREDDSIHFDATHDGAIYGNPQ